MSVALYHINYKLLEIARVGVMKNGKSNQFIVHIAILDYFFGIFKLKNAAKPRFLGTRNRNKERFIVQTSKKFGDNSPYQ